MRYVPLLFWLAWPLSVMAYRPFVSTDAAVAEKGVSEVELGVFDFNNRRGRNTATSPSVRYNLGLVTNLEVVAEGALQVFDSASHRDLQILDPQLNLKGVFLNGPLQEGHWPISMALEIGALLPETVRDSGFGFQGVLIGSFRTGKFTWHLNAGGGLERETLEPLAIWGVIVERPIVEKLRIAAEFSGESIRGSRADNSALLALLWDYHKITFDAGVRFGLSKDAPNVGFTTGLTFRF